MKAFDPYLFALATPLLLCAMGVMCVCVWHYHRSHRYLLWQAANLLLVATAVIAQTLMRTQSPYISTMWLAALYVASGICLAQSLAVRLGQRLPWLAIAAVVCASAAAMWHFLHIAPSIAGRITAISLGLGVLVSLCLPRLWTAPKRHALDHIALALLALSTLAALARPLLLLEGSAPAPSPSPTHTLVWWYAILTWLLLYVPYSIVLCACAVLDAMRELRQERDHDALTGLLNRRAFQALCTASPYARGVRIVVTCDLDHFKRINDRYGHLVGDDVLRHFAYVLRSNLRGHDVVARMGGEEFAIALWNVDMDQAVALVQRVAQALAHTTWSRRTDVTLKVTASFGLVEVSPFEWLEQTLQRADVQLYAAKNAGRNCIRTAQAPAATELVRHG